MAVEDTDSESEQRYEAFLSLFARDRDRLFRYIYSLLTNHADAEDLFQRCSLLLWRKFPEFDDQRSFLAWASGVALNEVRNFLRTADRRRLKFDSDLITQLSDQRLHELDDVHDVLGNLKVLQSCVDALPPRERELVQIAYARDSSLKDFAEATGQALQTLYNRMGRIRRMLLECVRRKSAGEAVT